MNHNDTVKQSFKNQAEKFAAYHMSKTESLDRAYILEVYNKIQALFCNSK